MTPLDIVDNFISDSDNSVAMKTGISIVLNYGKDLI